MKNNYWKLVLFTLLFCATSSNYAQVVFREYLSQDHQGIIEESINFPGESLSYEWQFIDAEKGQYFAEGEAIQRIHYQLVLSKNGQELGRFDLQIRDLIVSHYIEISAIHQEESRTIMALYNKVSRWVKLKGIVPEDCRRANARWGRLDAVDSYERLLHFVVSKLDENLVFSCYF